MAEVRMSTEEYHELCKAREQANQEVAKLKIEVVKARSEGAPSSDTLTKLSRHLLQCVRFAVGQMPPEATKGWPSQDLEAACDLLPAMIDYNSADAEIASAFRSFVQEIAVIEKFRESLRQTPKTSEPIVEQVAVNAPR